MILRPCLRSSEARWIAGAFLLIEAICTISIGLFTLQSPSGGGMAILSACVAWGVGLPLAYRRTARLKLVGTRITATAFGGRGTVADLASARIVSVRRAGRWSRRVLITGPGGGVMWSTLTAPWDPKELSALLSTIRAQISERRESPVDEGLDAEGVDVEDAYAAADGASP